MKNMKRAERRHHSRRIKKAWYNWLRHVWAESFWKKKPTFESELQRAALLRASHPACPCFACRSERYNRAEVEKLMKTELLPWPEDD